MEIKVCKSVDAIFGWFRSGRSSPETFEDFIRLFNEIPFGSCFFVELTVFVRFSKHGNGNYRNVVKKWFFKLMTWALRSYTKFFWNIKGFTQTIWKQFFCFLTILAFLPLFLNKLLNTVNRFNLVQIKFSTEGASDILVQI